MAKITLIGMYNFFPELFDKMALPEGAEKNTLIDTMLMRSAEFEVVYADPSFMQNILGLLSTRWYKTFERWIKALNTEYNPLENYDRFEESTDTSSNSFSNTDISSYTNHTEGDSTSANERDEDTTHGTATTEVKVSAMNSSTYAPDSKTESSQLNDLVHIEDGVTNHNEVDSTDSGSTDRRGTDSGNNHHTARLHGNIGVTTSQQMLEAEMELAERWANIYDHMADVILKEIVIAVY